MTLIDYPWAGRVTSKTMWVFRVNFPPLRFEGCRMEMCSPRLRRSTTIGDDAKVLVWFC